MLGNIEITNDEEMTDIDNKHPNPLGYMELFEYFVFTDEEKQNPNKIDMLKTIHSYVAKEAQNNESTPIQELVKIERGLSSTMGVDRLQKVYHAVRLMLSIDDKKAQLEVL